MTIDPRTPVLVGGGQVSDHDGGREPVDLLEEAARLAAQEAGVAALLPAVDSIRVVGLLSWRYRDPGALVADRIGATGARTGYTGTGGSTPQALVNAAAEDILAGRSDVVLVGGAESWRTRMKLRAQGQRPDWTVQDESVPKAPMLVPEVPMRSDAEVRAGLDRPAYIYPLIEQAVRLSAGRRIDDHMGVIGDLWSSFSEVAEANPHAWTRRRYSAEELTTPSAGNRWISWPYPKLLNSNNMVDQGAALLLCSAGTAERLGVPRDAWVFPQAGTEAHDTFDIGARAALDRSPAIRLAGARALELAGVDAGDVAHVDVYSCFPSAVQVAAAELGLPIGDPDRPLTVTGGLSFAGGPWNNYSTHAIATLATRLRDNPGDTGLVTANGGYLTKHAFGVYRTEPPADGFRRENLQERVAAEPTTASHADYSGPALLEAWTVTFDREGAPETGLISARTPDGGRALAAVTDGDGVERLLGEREAGAPLTVDEAGRARFGDG